MIHKDTDQILTDGPMKQQRCNRRIHTAGQGKKHLFPRKLRAIPRYHPFRMISGVPVALTAADRKEKIADDLTAKRRVGHLRMELDAIQFFFIIAHGGAGALRGDRNRLKPIRYRVDIICVTHPADALLRDPLKQQMIFCSDDRFPVFTVVFCTGDFTAGHCRQQLGSVADTQDRDPKVQNLRVVMG